MAQPSAADGWDMPVDSSGHSCPDSSDQWTAVDCQKVPASRHFIGTPLITPLSTATTMVLPDMHDVPQLAQQAQQAALLGNCVGINGALGLTPQPGHVEVTKYMPPPVETLSEDAWQAFRQVLEDHGLDPDAGDKIECGQLKLGYKPMHVCQDMERRYANCPYDKWDWESVPARQNPQMHLVVKAMMEMFTAADQVNGKMLWAVVANGKLLTSWYQYLRSTKARDEYMAYEHQGQRFDYHRHNEGFKKYCKKWQE